MNSTRSCLAIRAIVGAGLGVGLGLVIGWRVWPVQYTNTLPTVLHQVYRDDYIVMVATAYAVEGDLGQASMRLHTLSPEHPELVVIDLAERLQQAVGSPRDIELLTRLALDLAANQPQRTPQSGGGP